MAQVQTPRVSSIAGGGAAPFTPASITGLKVWLKSDGTLWQDSARTTPVTSDADPVGAWDDASGSGNHLLQATADSRPAYKTAIQNGLAAVLFDGVDDTLAKVFSGSQAQPNTIVVAYKFVATGTSKAVFDSTTAAGQLFDINVSTWRAFAGLGLDRGAPDTNWHIASVLFNTTASTIRLEGAQVGAAGSVATAAMAGLQLGARGGAASFGNLYIGEIVVYPSALSVPNQQALETYMNGRWAVY